MRNRRVLAYGAASAVLAALVWLQFRGWQSFDWTNFWNRTSQVSKLQVFYAILLNYCAYVLRSMRWKVFLCSVRPDARSVDLIPPTIIGFTGLALLGRPGELIRPYLIARREKLTFSSQLAIWTIERLFDLGAFGVLLVSAIFFARDAQASSTFIRFQRIGVILIGLVAVFVVISQLVSRTEIAAKVEHHLAGVGGERIAGQIREFRSALSIAHSKFSVFTLVTLSVLMWYTIALAYQQVTSSYGAEVVRTSLSKTVILMGFSMLGSLVQLPGVGGGSQLANIAALERICSAPHELAASCGIVLWLVTVVSVVPLGLLLAHYERLSLRQLSLDSRKGDGKDLRLQRRPSDDFMLVTDDN